MGKKEQMYVYKRDGRKEAIHFDKITSRIQKVCYGLDLDFVDPVPITLKVVNGVYTGVHTQELDNLAAVTAAKMATDHADYALLAARLAVSNLHKETKKQFSDVINDLYNAKLGSTPLISEQHHKIIMENASRLNSAIIYDRDFNYNYFGFKTLEASYLLRIDGKVVERPQHMLMRLAVGIHSDDIDAVIETYDLMSERYYTHSSSTLLSAATTAPHFNAAYLLSMSDDSIEGIFGTLQQCALISLQSTGSSMNVHCIRAKGTYIAGTNGISNGLVPMLRVYDGMVEHSSKKTPVRPSKLTIYIEPWHADIFELLDLKQSGGMEYGRARELDYALWIPDLFMRRVEEDGDWSLMCPHQCPGLFDSFGEEFERLYIKYESEGRRISSVKAQKLWFAITKSQIETGTPQMLYKDACNRKTNQQNLGTIRSGSLCGEIIEYSSKDEISVCNVASIAVNMFVKPDRSFDFVELKEVAKVVTRNLNKMIDITTYPISESKYSNLRHRPIGVGVQGLADAFILMRYPYESDAARNLNKHIFETIYYGTLDASCELAEKYGPYESYENSPVSKGLLQYDMWNREPSNLWNWTELKKRIATHGIRNSLVTAAIPTSTTAQILGNNESFEPYTSNIYNRNIQSDNIQVVNPHLIKDLSELDLWDVDMKNRIVDSDGSIQTIDTIPQPIRDLYKTVWEISVKTMISMAIDRGAFIDQSQSFNIHISNQNYGKLTSMHFYGWKEGMKTGMNRLLVKPVSSRASIDEEISEKLNDISIHNGLK